MIFYLKSSLNQLSIFSLDFLKKTQMKNISNKFIFEFVNFIYFARLTHFIFV